MSTSINPADRLMPTGTVTFLFTDIEGSTSLAQNYPDEMHTLLERHHTILRQSIEAHHGVCIPHHRRRICLLHSIPSAMRSSLRSMPSVDCSRKSGIPRRSRCAWASIPARRKQAH